MPEREEGLARLLLPRGCAGAASSRQSPGPTGLLCHLLLFLQMLLMPSPRTTPPGEACTPAPTVWGVPGMSSSFRPPCSDGEAPAPFPQRRSCLDAILGTPVVNAYNPSMASASVFVGQRKVSPVMKT